MELDKQALFEAMYRDTVRTLFRYVLVKTNRENAHDVISSTYLVAWRRFDDVPQDALPWLIGVARRVLADNRRSEMRQAALVQRLSGRADTADASLVEDAIESILAPGSIMEALRQLRPEDREVLILVAWHDFNTEKLATALGSSKAVASLRLHRARNRFGRTLNIQQQKSGIKCFEPQRKSNEKIPYSGHVSPGSGETISRRG